MAVRTSADGEESVLCLGFGQVSVFCKHKLEDPFDLWNLNLSSVRAPSRQRIYTFLLLLPLASDPVTPLCILHDVRGGKAACIY